MSIAGPRLIAASRAQPWVAGAGLGFLFWTTFLIALEPDAISRSLDGGVPLTLGGETARIAGAGLLGAAVSPAVALLVVRFPVAEGRVLRRLALHLGGSLALALALVVMAHGLAWALLNGPPCTPASFGRDLASNWLLLTFCVAVFDGLLHARQGCLPAAASPAAPSALRDHGAVDLPGVAPTEFQVRDRGRLTRVPVGDILWVAAEGNYVALHAGGVRHLVREPLAKMEVRLRDAGFLRVHRSALVAVRHVRTVQRLPGGDALAKMTDGSERRVSRTYAKSLLAALTRAD